VAGDLAAVNEFEWAVPATSDIGNTNDLLFRVDSERGGVRSSGIIDDCHDALWSGTSAGVVLSPGSTGTPGSGGPNSQIHISEIPR
jgi:hypothetical protein